MTLIHLPAPFFDGLSKAEHDELLRSIHGAETMARIAAHNARIDRVWANVGPDAKPFHSSPSAVPAAGLSRIEAAMHGGNPTPPRPMFKDASHG